MAARATIVTIMTSTVESPPSLRLAPAIAVDADKPEQGHLDERP
jgi:hypothetical protein